MPMFFNNAPTSAAVDPTTTDDATKGRFVGQSWFNTVTGNLFYCTDTTASAAVWKHVPRVFAASAAAIATPADTTEDILVTIAIPAGSMGVNGILRVQTLWTLTNSGNNKSCRVKFGASGAGTSGTSILDVTVTTIATMADQKVICNRNSASSQVGKPVGGMGAGGWGTATAAIVTAAINTAAATEIAITGQKASSGEVLQLESYMVELIRP